MIVSMSSEDESVGWEEEDLPAEMSHALKKKKWKLGGMAGLKYLRTSAGWMDRRKSST